MILFLILHIYFVSFLDKPEKTAPQLSERAWEQRAKWDIPTDAMDYPVSSSYQNALIKMGVKIHHKSRWFNGVTCEMDEATAAQVAELKFVTDVEMTRENSDVSSQLSVISFQKSAVRSQYSAAGEEPENWTDKQLALYNLKALHEAGFEGQGILMAICDGSFYDADKLDCFRQKELEL